MQETTMANKELELVLENQVNEGAQARAQLNIVEPYIEAKTGDLFKAFIECSTDDKEKLFDIKLQLNALRGLKADFDTKIETAKLADTQLAQLKENHDE
jgi:hypothetical protein